MPGYFPQGELPAFGMSLVHVRYRDCFPKLDPKLDLRLGEGKVITLSPEDAKAFKGFGLRAWIDKAIQGRHGAGASAWEAKELRIIPSDGAVGSFGKGVRVQIIGSAP